MASLMLYVRIVLAVAASLVLLAIDIARFSLGGVVINGILLGAVLFLLVPPLLRVAKTT